MKKSILILLLLGLFTTLFASVGRITVYKGEALILRGNENIKVTKLAFLRERDIIQTKQETTAQVAFKDATIVTIGSNSTLSIEDYVFDKEKPKVRFGMNRGIFKTITGRIGKIAPDSFKIKVRTATMGIRGTVIGVENADVMCLSGEITMTSAKTGKTTVVRQGFKTKVTKKQTIAEPIKIAKVEVTSFHKNLGTEHITPEAAPKPEEIKKLLEEERKLEQELEAERLLEESLETEEAPKEPLYELASFETQIEAPLPTFEEIKTPEFEPIEDEDLFGLDENVSEETPVVQEKKEQGLEDAVNEAIARYMENYFEQKPASAQKGGPLSLEAMAQEVLRTHPDILERIRFLRSVEQDKEIAKALFLPSLDFSTEVGPERTKSSSTGFKNKNLTSKTTELTLVQNIFNGYSDIKHNEKQKARLASAIFSLKESINSVLLELSEKYINVLRQEELLGLAKENLQINIKTHQDITTLHQAGLGSKADLEQAAVKLSSARANYVSVERGFFDAMTAFHRTFGRFVPIKQFVMPNFNYDFPLGIDEATKQALYNHPSIKVSAFNKDASYKEYEKSLSAFLPTLDAELYQQIAEDTSGTEGDNNSFHAYLRLNYNLYRGGADKAEVQKNISNVNADNEVLRSTKRQVIESIRFSWVSREMISRQNKYLAENTALNEKTLASYKEEFDLGRRDLLDLLSVQEDLYSAKVEHTNAQYDLLFTNYRILEGIGEIGDYFGVNLSNQSEIVFNTKDKIDTLPLNNERDNDKLVDTLDICVNTQDVNASNSFGCNYSPIIKSDVTKIQAGEEEVREEVQEEETSSLDDALAEAFGSEEDTESSLDTLADEVLLSEESREQRVNKTEVFVNQNITFLSSSTTLTKDSAKELEKVYEQLRDKHASFIEVIAHSDASGPADKNLLLSQERAQTIKQYFVSKGLDADSIEAIGRGEEEPLVSNKTPEGRAQNRRVEFRVRSSEVVE